MGCPDVPYVEVGNVQTTYIVNENEGPVEVCVSAYYVDVNIDYIMIRLEAFDFNHSIYIPSGAVLASK